MMTRRELLQRSAKATAAVVAAPLLPLVPHQVITIPRRVIMTRIRVSPGILAAFDDGTYRADYLGIRRDRS